MKTKTIALLIPAICLFFMVSNGWAGNKKIMTTRAAKVLAERAIVESIYGLKVRSTEQVVDMVAANFSGKTESKTAATIKGIKIEEVTYDSAKDIAKATASIILDTFTNIDGQEMNLKGKLFRRVAFATSTPSQAGPVQALRAAELDAYKQLAKLIVGFTLESETTVENYILTSDIVKSKVLATMYLAEVSEYGWDSEGDAFVKMILNVKEVGAIIGLDVVGQEEIIEVEGQGAQMDDFEQAR
ncbi:MAG: hypothetical protein KAR13_17960 [Desulfobulbaceae bacterium]|nr:hypothetical protein [Desulfobulbaceae bacterium]